MTAGKKSRMLLRIACLAVALLGIGFVFRNFPVKALVQTLRNARYGWYFCALLAYGLMFLPAALRWRLAVRATGCPATPMVAARITIIGHFFYNLLFGAAGGDTAKSALYAKWYGFPLEKVLAAAPLDRTIGFLGLVVFGLVTVILGMVSGGFHLGAPMALHVPRWVPWLVVPLLLIGIWTRRSSADSRWRRFIQSFRSGVRKLLKSPGSLAGGVAHGFLVQLALAGVLALNLKAVFDTDLPWLRLAWVFPVIVLASGLPITVAGLGTREGAAIVLLKLYDVPASQAAAASLLTLSVSLFWALAGGIVFLMEEARQKARKTGPEEKGGVSQLRDCDQTVCDVPIAPEPGAPN